jgi:preprotein translocase subunit SecE
MNNFITYIKETREELKHVSWPTQKQTVVYTATVVALSALVSVFLGFFDFLFSKGVSFLIG